MKGQRVWNYLKVMINVLLPLLPIKFLDETGRGSEMMEVESRFWDVAVLLYHPYLEKNMECCDGHTPHMARLFRTDFCRYDNPLKLGARGPVVGLFYAAFEHGVEVDH